MSRIACTRRALPSDRCRRSMATVVSHVLSILHHRKLTLYFVCGAVVSLRSAPMLAAVGGAVPYQPSVSQAPSRCTANVPDAMVCCGGGVKEHCLEIASGTRVDFWRCHPSAATCVLAFPLCAE